MCCSRLLVSLHESSGSTRKRAGPHRDSAAYVTTFRRPHWPPCRTSLLPPGRPTCSCAWRSEHSRSRSASSASSVLARCRAAASSRSFSPSADSWAEAAQRNAWRCRGQCGCWVAPGGSRQAFASASWSQHTARRGTHRHPASTGASPWAMAARPHPTAAAAAAPIARRWMPERRQTPPAPARLPPQPPPQFQARAAAAAQQRTGWRRCRRRSRRPPAAAPAALATPRSPPAGLPAHP